MIGLVFAEEAEAKVFSKKVNNRKVEKCISCLPVAIRLADTFFFSKSCLIIVKEQVYKGRQD